MEPKFVSTCKQTLNWQLPVFFAAAATMCLGVGAYFALLPIWSATVALGALALFLVAVAKWQYDHSKTVQKCSIVFDDSVQTITFSYFVFNRSIFPEKAKEEQSIPYADVLYAKNIEISRGERGYELRTPLGRVSISQRMEGFHEIGLRINRIMDANMIDKEAYKKRRAELEPKIETPWYLWAGFAAIMLALAYMAWRESSAQ